MLRNQDSLVTDMSGCGLNDGFNFDLVGICFSPSSLDSLWGYMCMVLGDFVQGRETVV
jgi:hypothetical protein